MNSVQFMGFEGVSAVVWGDGRGVGDAIAQALSAEGAAVVHAGSAAGETDVSAAIDGSASLDLLVVCLEGPSDRGQIAELSDEDWNEELDRGMGLAFRGIRSALSRMLPRESGRILVVTPAEAKLPHAGATAYAAAQHGVTGLVKSVAHEVGRQGIAVNALVCGIVGEAVDAFEEDLVQRSSLKRPLTPSEVAAAAVTISAPERTSITGTIFPVHGGVIPY
jgi:NAD(P)-dependent dehydrogenase (short-subunit alcohol dehydrogenase family)